MSFLGGALEGFGSSRKEKNGDRETEKPPTTKDTDSNTLVRKAMDYIKKRRQVRKDREMELPIEGRKSSGELNPMKPVPEYKRGGKIRKTGKAKLHKGEKVVPKRSKKR